MFCSLQFHDTIYSIMHFEITYISGSRALTRERSHGAGVGGFPNLMSIYPSIDIIEEFF